MRRTKLSDCSDCSLTINLNHPILTLPNWGRTGFDFADTPEAACRGRFVGLVNHSNQKLVANEELALAA